MNIFPLSFPNKVCLWVLSFLLVAFGQPTWGWWIGLVASICGYAIFWRVLLGIPKKSTRFFIAFGWAAAVQIVQLSWMASHPYLYILGVILFCGTLVGTQFGLLALLIQPQLFSSLSKMLAVAALWTILEWSRLFLLSGLAFNPAGIALTGAIYPLQFASLGGVYLLSFWIILTNLLALRTWIQHFSKKSLVWWGSFALIPYLFGFIHFHFHVKAMEESLKKENSTLSALLIQTAFSIEENMGFQTAEEARQFVMEEWRQILTLASKYQNKLMDLVILPENVVPYGTYYFVFQVDKAKALFKEIFGEQVEQAFPPLEEPYASYVKTYSEPQWLVSNAFFVQTLANILNADVVVGLEDAVQVTPKQAELYSAAFHFIPYQTTEASRYEKRVLVPMGEYIPFEFCRALAAQYGIQGSFTPGQSAKIFNGKVPFGPSICYEEMYGNLMRENRVQGAELLVNLTNDGWYPNSTLPQQHFDHSCLRTVENGIPLLRACNTGITAGVDSLGRVVSRLEEKPEADSLYVTVPKYHYNTLYARLGDALIIGLCLIFLFGFLRNKI